MIDKYVSMFDFGDIGRSDTDRENSKANISNQNADIAYMEKQAIDFIYESGLHTLVYLRVNDLGNVDVVWEEDNDPLYHQPVKVKGQFVPEQMVTSLKKWGVESETKFKINYSRAQLLNMLGTRLIRKGDVIKIDHNTLVQTQNTEFIDGEFGVADKFRVIDAFDTGNFNYRWLYWTCIVESLTGDITVRPDDVNL